MKYLKAAVGISLLFATNLLAQQPPAAVTTPPHESNRFEMPGSPLGIAWGILYGYEGVKAEEYMPQLREMGAGFTKVYLFWNQIEPEKGRYDWTAVDAFVDQLKSPHEGLISLFSTSMWAVKRPTTQLPPSPANNPDDYYRFVHDTVTHCKGKVRYWQNDAEPNNPIFWSGTKEEFVAQLKIFYRAVKDADPAAVVVVGGYDGLFNPPSFPPMPNQQAGLDFFDYVLKEGRDAFDVFDLRLYANTYTIPLRLKYMREQMQSLGYNKPIICGEYGGPGFFGFPENRKYFSLLTSWTSLVTNPTQAANKNVAQPVEELYQHMSTLAPQTQMFMQGCPAELDDKYQRIQCRELAMRNLLAFSAGAQKTLYWQLSDASTRPRDNVMTLMFGKVGMLRYEDGVVKKRYPVADAYERMAKALAGIRSVKQIYSADKPNIYLFAVDRGERGPLHVVWEKRDSFSGEDLPDTSFEMPWTAQQAEAVDALGKKPAVQIESGRLQIGISATPIYLEAGR